MGRDWSEQSAQTWGHESEKQILTRFHLRTLPMHLVLPLLNQLRCRKSNRGAFRGHLSANPLTTKPSWYEESPRFTPLNPTYENKDVPPVHCFLGIPCVHKACDPIPSAIQVVRALQCPAGAGKGCCSTPTDMELVLHQREIYFAPPTSHIQQA